MKRINYPDCRARVTAPVGTYRLDAVDRDIVGTLHLLRLWSATQIGATYGIDRSAVVRHGQRMAARWTS